MTWLHSWEAAITTASPESAAPTTPTQDHTASTLQTNAIQSCALTTCYRCHVRVQHSLAEKLHLYQSILCFAALMRYVHRFHHRGASACGNSTGSDTKGPQHSGDQRGQKSPSLTEFYNSQNMKQVCLLLNSYVSVSLLVVLSLWRQLYCVLCCSMKLPKMTPIMS